jgi:hypothetical protein
VAACCRLGAHVPRSWECCRDRCGGQVESHVQATTAFADKLTSWLDLLRSRAARTGDDDAETAADVRALLGEALVPGIRLGQRGRRERDAASCRTPSGTDACGFGEILYSIDRRTDLPEEAVLASLGCGDPTAVVAAR